MILDPWSTSAIGRASSAQVPQLPFRGWSLIQGDARALWLKWLVQDAVPSKGLTGRAVDDYLLVLANALRVVQEVEPLADSKERSDAAQKLAKIAYALVQSEGISRARISRALRSSVLAIAGAHPRCWICGSEFGRTAMSAFRGELSGELRQNLLPDVAVDFCYPRGLSGLDFAVEVEHATPVSAGGKSELDNLRLACRFCNLAKRDAVSIYSRSRGGATIEHPTLGQITLPNITWVVRQLVAAGRCAECGVGTPDRRLYSANVSGSAYLNPGNLRLFCEVHDPWRGDRWVTKSVLRR